MINTEYIRSLNANYERMALGEKPEEKRYQYCMNQGIAPMQPAIY